MEKHSIWGISKNTLFHFVDIDGAYFGSTFPHLFFLVSVFLSLFSVGSCRDEVTVVEFMDGHNIFVPDRHFLR